MLSAKQNETTKFKGSKTLNRNNLALLETSFYLSWQIFAIFAKFLTKTRIQKKKTKNLRKILKIIIIKLSKMFLKVKIYTSI